MALFQKDKDRLNLIKQTRFNKEKELQSLIEKNLDIIFNCRFIATEFPTGPVHAGRIDTLALSEDDNPVIIEYKNVESSELINQSLFYLSWIKDHRGDFQIVVDKALGKKIDVDWAGIRVICIAPGYKKYDLHAVQMMGANIELWEYKFYENGAFYLDEVFRRTTVMSDNIASNLNGKNPVMVAAGKKAALTKATGSYTFEMHLNKADNKLKDIVLSLQSYIMQIDDSIEENPKKFYIAYKISQNFACVEVQKNKIILNLKINPDEIKPLPTNARDVRNIGHYGTGDFEYVIKNEDDFEKAKDYILKAFDNIGG